MEINRDPTRKASKLAMMLSGVGVAAAITAGTLAYNLKTNAPGPIKPLVETFVPISSGPRPVSTDPELSGKEIYFLNKIREIRSTELGKDYGYKDLITEVESFKQKNNLPESYDIRDFLANVMQYKETSEKQGKSFDPSAYLTDIDFR